MWPGISLDLTGAALVDFNFARVSVVRAWFNKATFHKAIFEGVAALSGATFQRGVLISGATFQGGALFDGAQVLHLDYPRLNNVRVWPVGYTVRPDPADPTRGTLVHSEQAEEPEPAVPPPDPTDR